MTVVKQEGEKFQQYFCATIASLGSLMVGISLGWTSPGFTYLQSNSSNTPLQLDADSPACDWIGSWMPIGAAIGALPAGVIGDLVGKKTTLIIFSIPYAATWILTTYVSSVTWLYVARFLSGIIVGIYCGVIPTYLTEIAEDSVRGTVGTLFQLFMTLGILLDYAMGSFNSYYVFSYGITAVNVVFLVCLVFIPESPNYLVNINHEKEAEKCLRRLRGKHYNVRDELDELIKQRERSKTEKTSWSALLSRATVKGLTISIGLMALQQFSGINCIIFYVEQIFEDAGVSSPSLCSIIVGIMQSAATAVSSALIDRVGRKVLLVISGGCMTVSALGLGYYFWLKADPTTNSTDITWLSLVCVVVFIIGFSFGVGPVPWIIFGEVLAPEVKRFGSGLAASTNWIATSIVTFFFHPLMQLISPPFTFWLFGIICVIIIAFVVGYLPETKGKSLSQIQAELAGGKITHAEMYNSKRY